MKADSASSQMESLKQMNIYCPRPNISEIRIIIVIFYNYSDFSERKKWYDYYKKISQEIDKAFSQLTLRLLQNHNP